MMIDCLTQWATILSPIIGVIAISISMSENPESKVGAPRSDQTGK